jgi:Brp/Blh family beta-carotene 15,15'-monooxygenase
MKRVQETQRGLFFFAAAGAFGLGWSNVQLSPGFIAVSLAGLVAIVGLPHGALDPLVARQAGLWRTPLGLAGFLIAYLLLAGVAGLLWFYAPMLALIGFLAYSAWHFSGDWRDDLPLGLRLCAGVAIVSAPALLHRDLVTEYFSLLAGPRGAAALVQVLAWLALPALLGMATAAARCRRDRWVISAELMVLATAAVMLTPLVLFLLYFCGLHSPRHLLHAAEGLNRKAATATAVGLTVITVALAALVVVLGPPGRLDERLLQLTFIALAVLTVPHMVLIEYWAARAASLASSQEAYKRGQTQKIKTG